jgi:hypothetical protein
VSRRTLIWLAPLLLTVHNAEEAVAFTSYLPHAAALLPVPLAAVATRITYPAMLVALAVVSSLAVLVALVADRHPSSPRALWVLLALEATVGLNVIAHVTSALVLFRGYGPGLVTAILMNAPFVTYCFRRATREGWVSSAALWATIPAAVVLHGPVLVGLLWLVARRRP